MLKWALSGWCACVLGVMGVACSSERQDVPARDAGQTADQDASAPGDGTKDAGPDAHVTAVYPIGSSIVPVPDGGLGDLGPLATPQNVSFATARPFQVGAEISQRVFTGLQADYYSFEAQADTFYELRTNRSEVSPNNVISVFDAQHHLVAENDNGALWPGDFVDARLVLRFPQAGLYYVRVEDRVTDDELFRNPFALPFSYRLRIRTIDADTPGFARQDGQDGDEPTEVNFEHDANSGNAYVTVLGVLGEGARFDLVGQASRALIGQLAFAGIAGDGSTAHGVRVQVVQEDGRVVSSIEQERSQVGFHPPVADGRYQVRVKADAPAGDNDFYAIDLVLLEDNPTERNEAQNGRMEMAEALQWKGNIRRRAVFLARLPADDVDYYRIDVNPDEHVMVVCEAESGGSGVRGLHAEVLDASQHKLVAADEPSTENLHIADAPVKQAGTYYLRLSGTTPKDGEARVDPWVRCAVIAQI